MMTRYSVRCGLAGIYAGILKNANEWKTKTPVTEEAIDAARDWLFQNMKEGENINGYTWKMKDGREIQLILRIQKPEEENNTEEKND